jgi:hypothetical protein
LEQDFRNFAFDIDPSGGYWVALSDTANSVRVFRSADGVSWTLDTVISSPGRQTMGHLAIASDRNGQIGLSFYRTTTSATPQVIRWIYTRGSAPTDAWAAFPVSGIIPLFSTSDGRLLGDYQGMGIVDASLFPSGGATFFPVWTGHRRVRECHHARQLRELHAVKWTGVFAVAVLVAGCSCASTHELGDGGTISDATGDTTGADSGPHVCDPTPPSFGATGGCTPDANAQCAAWAQSLAPAGTTAYSACSPNGGYICVRGGNCSGDPRHFQCTCANFLPCSADEVCVSDVPGGTMHCVPACGA